MTALANQAHSFSKDKLHFCQNKVQFVGHDIINTKQKVSPGLVWLSGLSIGLQTERWGCQVRVTQETRWMQRAREQGLLAGNKRESGANRGRLGSQPREDGTPGGKMEPTKGGWNLFSFSQIRVFKCKNLQLEYQSLIGQSWLLSESHSLLCRIGRPQTLIFICFSWVGSAGTFPWCHFIAW